MVARALAPAVASLVFGTSAAPPAFAEEDYVPSGGESARLGAQGGYDVTGVIETQETSASGATYHAPSIPVRSAYAANLTASDDTCMGSRTFGVQLAGFGISFATTWRD